MLTVYRYKVMTAIFVSERLINSKNNILLLFDESNYLFAFTKSVIKIYTDIKNMLTEFEEQSIFSF